MHTLYTQQFSVLIRLVDKIGPTDCSAGRFQSGEMECLMQQDNIKFYHQVGGVGGGGGDENTADSLSGV